ncbi:MAG TPA: phosphoadenosine phosphosulfate reductase family protein [Candidatus Dormibacteraeota bacterium]|nr:phosphoadenosine phosphosulfate reductase family protein [Candidatus Dormibacteraeota bacterium]
MSGILPVNLIQLETPTISETSSETMHRLDMRIRESEDTFKRILDKGFRRWMITYSGGKDSTAAVCLAFEMAKRGDIDPPIVDVVYADTRMEIPLLRAQAFRFLDALRKRSTACGLPFRCHIRTPDVRKGFWYLLLGKGYPPPHQRFRWCTRRLKIEPMRDLVSAAGKSGKTCVITGVRFNESENRDRALSFACKRGGECGQGMWYWERKRLNVAYLAPIVNWRDCDVWDFLLLYMAEEGWPTKTLYDLYQTGRDLRFGCWMCTVVRQDRTMNALVNSSKNAFLEPLIWFRNHVIEATSTTLAPSSRLRRPDGALGRLTLETRKTLYLELLEVQKKVKLQLITKEERDAITKFWRVTNGNS